MHIRKIAALMLAAVSALIVFTGCSSYTPGKVKDGVYRNSYFTVTTPEGFACFTGKQVENVSCYIVEYANSTARGAQKSFNCEYAAKNAATEILVISEDNVGGRSMDDFTSVLTSQSNTIFFTAEVKENKDIVIDGMTFRHLKLSLGGTGVYKEYFIRQQGTKNVYICIEYIDNIIIDNSDKALSSISASV
ncbi:MAG: hypothetical protein J6I96_04980 [Oscillospiraceae bacterium]|nr:hypothetical protein [Oscillospiraceae bacterium]